MDKTVKTLVFWIVVFVSAFLLWQTVKAGGNQQAVPEISYSEFLLRVASAKVAKVTIAGHQVTGTDRDGSLFRVITPANQEPMLEGLQRQGVEIWFKDVGEASLPLQLLGTWAPLILLAALWFFMIRQMKLKQAQTEIK